MTRVREKQLQKRKQETLDVTLRMLMDRGYANFNMDELADEVGISKPTLYQYFNSKDELVAQAFVYMFEQMSQHLLESSGGSPLGQLEQFMRAMLRGRAEQQGAFGMMDIETMRSIVFRNGNVIERLRETRSKVLVVVQKAKEVGEIDLTIPDWVIVNTIFSLQGAINNRFTKLQENLTEHSHEETVAAIESVILMFRRGVSAVTPGPDRTSSP